jgi:hypothetical protein
LFPVPAQAKPSAIAAPHRTYGLYDSANKLTTEGNCSGVLKIINYFKILLQVQMLSYNDK